MWSSLPLLSSVRESRQVPSSLTFHNMLLFMTKGCNPHDQHRSLKTTHYRLSVTVHSTYLQLSSARKLRTGHSIEKRDPLNTNLLKYVYVRLAKHHTRKTYWGSAGIAPRILNLGTRRRWVVSFAPRPLYSHAQWILHLNMILGYCSWGYTDPIKIHLRLQVKW
jgi:hypothetical protein